jgi:hypothetical protein
MIRILTLLVSLFTFGLVDLAEINYEIPVIDMLHFNDTPILELNYNTLNEVFRDGNLLNDLTLTSGVIDNSTDTQFIINTIGYSYAWRFLEVFPSGEYTNSYYFYMDVIFNDTLNRIDAGNNILYSNLRNTTPILSKKFDLTQIITTDVTRKALNFRQTITGQFIADKPFLLINLTSLGLTSLTRQELDRYYELWNNPELNITYEINTLDTQDLVILLASQSVWTIIIHLLYKYAYRPKKKSKRLGM